MEIHKPKAAANWREFAIEIGTIICGILIALGLEQAIEAVHRNTLRHDAREAIRGEIRRNLGIFARRDHVQRCIDERLQALEALLVSPAAGEHLPRPLWVGRPQVWSISESRWTASTSGGRTALLSPDEQARYGEVYAAFRELDDAERVEQLAWAHLRELETLPSLDVGSRGRLIEALHEARYSNFRIKIAGAQERQMTQAIGVSADPSTENEGSRSVCVPLNTTREEGLKLSAPVKATIQGERVGGRVIAEP
jgi:hypothetical protein